MNAVSPDVKRRRAPRHAKDFLRIMTLEPRLMFDGAAAADAAHAAVDASAKALIPAVAAPVRVQAADAAKDGGKTEVAFVDTSVSNWQALVAGLESSKPGMEIELIGGGQSGLAQMAVWAENHSGYDAIHVLSQGGEATVTLGSDSLTDATLTTPVAQAELAEIGHALKAGGEILLYGSDVADGADGKAFLTDLAADSGAVVAAADHAVGDAAEAGSWTLDVTTTPAAVPALDVPGYLGLLGIGDTAAANSPAPVLVQAADAGLDGGKLEVAFIDTSVSGWESLVVSVESSRPGAEIELIDGTESGLAQMVAWADTHSGYDAIHVLSAGSEGTLTLGTDTLADISLSNTEVRIDLHVIGASLKSGGEMLFYGSDIALGTDGQTFTADLVADSGRSVAAASGLVGDGHWALDTVTGASAVAALDAAGYDKTLDVAVAAHPIQPASAATATEVVVVDSTVVDWRTLIAGMDPSIPVIVLVPTADGTGELAELAAALSNFHNLDAIFLVTEGRNDGIILGQEALWDGDLQYATADITAIRDALKPGGDLLLFGCSVAGSADGEQFVNDLAADLGNGIVVAASTDKTGPTALGGDWTLEYATGTVAATVLPFTLQGMQDISHCLGCTDTLYTNNVYGTGGNYTNGWSIYASGVTPSTGKPGGSESAIGVKLTTGQYYTAAWAYVAGLGYDELTFTSGSTSWTSLTAFEAAHATACDYVVTPTTTVLTAILSADTGFSSADRITNTASQTITGTLSANLATGESVQVSLDGGNNWLTATASVGSSSWSLSGATLLAGSNTLEARVINGSGNGTAFSESYDLDTTAPALSTAAVNGSTLTLGYTETGSGIEAADTPRAAEFTVTVNGTTDTVTGVVLNAGAKTVTLTLATAVVDGDTVTMTYTADGTVSQELQDVAGNLAANVTGHAVTNNTADVAPTFTSATTTTSVAHDSYVDVTSLLHVGDTDFSQTETWTVTGTAAAHGTVTITNGTATSGSSDISPTGSIIYTPTAGYSGTDSFTIQVSDGTDTVTKTITVTITNAAPVLATTASASYTEKGAAVAVDSGITVSDSDNSTEASATVTISNNYVSGDTLAFTNASSSTYGNIAASWNASSHALTLTSSGSSATLAQWQAALEAVTFSASTTDPTNATRTVSWAIDDGITTNHASNTLTSTIAVTTVNDPPSITDSGTSPTFTETGSAVALFNVTALSAVEAGQDITTVVLTVSGIADGSNEKLVVDGTAIALNAASSGTTATDAIGYVVSWDGSSTATITLTKADTAANWKSYLNAITYEDLQTGVTAGSRTATLVSVQDNGGTANGGHDTTTVDTASTITVASINHAPDLSASGATTSFTEGGSGVGLFSGVAADLGTGDAASGQTIASIQLTVSNVSDGADEILTIDGTAVALTNGNSASGGGYSYAVAVAAGTATVTISGTIAIADVPSLIESITYKDISDDPNVSSSRVVSLTKITDSGGDTSPSVNNSVPTGTAATVTLLAVNNPPTLSATTATAALDTASTQTAPLFDGASVSAIESAQSIRQITLTVSAVADGASEILRVDGTDVALTNGTAGISTGGNAITYSVSVSGTTATVTFTKSGDMSDTVAQALVDGLTYRDTDANATAGDRMVTLTRIQDTGGTSNGGVDSTALSLVSTVTVLSNDAPTITVPAAQSASDLTQRSIGGLLVSDSLGGVYTVTVSALSGMIDLTGATVTAGANDSGSITFSGSEAQVNTVLATLKYTPTVYGSDTITIQVSDGGGAYFGGAKTGTASIVFTAIQPVLPKPIPVQPVPETPPVGTGQTNASTDSGPDSLHTIVRDNTATGGADGFPSSTDTDFAPPPPPPAYFQVAVVPPSVTGGDVLVVDVPIKDVTVAAGGQLVVIVSADAFAQSNTSEPVTLTAVQVDGSALPDWISFNPQSGTFEGTPPPGFTGEVEVKVIARDSQGREAAQVFKIVVGEARQGPVEPGGQGGDGRHGDAGDFGHKLAVVRPAGKPGLVEQLRAMSLEGRQAKQMAFIEALTRGGKAA